jgi:hypothetical protein
MEKYSRQNRAFTYFLQLCDSDELIAMSPAELFANESIKSQLTIAERERVAYTAGMQYEKNMSKQVAEIKKKAIDKKDSQELPRIRNRHSD